MSERKRATPSNSESEPKMIVFADVSNKKFEQPYADSVCAEFRKQTGWKVEPGTRIHTELQEFSQYYCARKRNVAEVVAIFRISHRLAGDLEPTKDKKPSED
jgi:hypothetical protein